MGHLPAILISVLLFSLTVLFFSLSFKQRREIAFCDNQLLRLIPQFPIFCIGRFLAGKQFRDFNVSLALCRQIRMILILFSLLFRTYRIGCSGYLFSEQVRMLFLLSAPCSR